MVDGKTTVGGVTGGLVVLGFIIKQAEQAMGGKPVSSSPPGPQLLSPPSAHFESLPWLLSLQTRKSNNPLTCKLLLAMMFYHSNSDLTYNRWGEPRLLLGENRISPGRRRSL